MKIDPHKIIVTLTHSNTFGNRILISLCASWGEFFSRPKFVMSYNMNGNTRHDMYVVISGPSDKANRFRTDSNTL